MFQDSEFDKLTKDDIYELISYFPINQLVRWLNYKALDLPLGALTIKKSSKNEGLPDFARSKSSSGNAFGNDRAKKIASKRGNFSINQGKNRRKSRITISL